MRLPSTPQSRRSQSSFACTSCGFLDHADLNAAKVLNIARANPWCLCLWTGVPVRGPVEAGNELGCVFHVALSKALPSPLRQGWVDYRAPS